MRLEPSKNLKLIRQDPEAYKQYRAILAGRSKGPIKIGNKIFRLYRVRPGGHREEFKI